MAREWQELTRMTGGQPVIIERVRLVDSGIAIEGEFELPPLVGLSAEDQIFLSAFVRSHGSIKQMEKYFGVSYPTIKNRLNRIAEKLEFVEVASAPDRTDLLDRIERGEISVDEAIKRMNEGE